ncbi:hypothetical protein [Moorena sp. SIO4G3]|nr:hypothetical protein [Moorena sp. SIO4G3]
MGESTAVAHGLFAFAFGVAVGQVTVRQARLVSHAKREWGKPPVPLLHR